MKPSIKTKKGYPKLWISERFYYKEDRKRVIKEWEGIALELKEVEIISHKMSSGDYNTISIIYQEWE